jgi:hypothetical protein
MVIIAGESGKTYVDEMIKQFGVDKHRFMLFHYDESDWSKFPWYNKVISIRFPGQMKWWYVKRFVVPEVVAPYEYIGFWDEDVAYVYNPNLPPSPTNSFNSIGINIFTIIEQCR